MKSTSPSGAERRVAELLLAQGPRTAAALADALGITGTAVRRQLDALEAGGLVVAADRAPYGPAPVRGRGRPAKVYALTPAGHDAVGPGADDLALTALRYLAKTAGDDAVRAFADQRAELLSVRWRARLAEVSDPAERAQVLADELSAEGYAASTAPATAPASGAQVCQHHCPVAHVAAEFPQLCEAETAAMADALGTHVTRLATIAHGDGVCTTLVLTPATGRSA